MSDNKPIIPEETTQIPVQPKQPKQPVQPAEETAAFASAPRQPKMPPANETTPLSGFQPASAPADETVGFGVPENGFGSFQDASSQSNGASTGGAGGTGGFPPFTSVNAGNPVPPKSQGKRRGLLRHALVILIVFLLLRNIGGCVGASMYEDDYDVDDYSYESSETYDYSDDYDYDESYDYEDSYDYDDGYESEDDYDTYYDAENDMTIITGDDGSALGYDSDGYLHYQDSDGTGMATDGEGNYIADTDGDGEVDTYSTDDGETWNEL